MAEALAIDVAKPVLGRVIDGIIDRVSNSLFVGDKVGDLEIQIERLKAKRRDVEDKIKADEPAGMVATAEAERWLESAAQLEEEAESIINKYRNRSCVLCCNFSVNLWSNHSISVKAIEAKTKVADELSSLTNIINKYPPPPVGLLVSTGSTLGAETGSEIKSKVEKALDFLRNSAEGMLGIWGMGGVGKTTVLNHVNNELAKDSSLGFHRVILVTASRECTVQKLQSLIVKALGLNPEDGDHKNTIFNFLRNKNFVILLDDLWERQDLDRVGVPHPGVSGELKQKLILTTRSLKVCVDMNVRRTNTIKVDCLCREKARRLFREKVGEEVINSHPLISSKLADEVADVCDGLPIALITIARSMAYKNSASDWINALKDLRESKISMISGGIDDPLPLLKVSYDYLKDPSLQECLLLCALWPEDYKIKISGIIECWMGHDLLGKFDTVGEAYENGRKIIDDLVKASLLERKRSVNPYFSDSVSLHDLIRDMALWIARDNERKWVVLSRVGSDKALGDQKSWEGAHKVSLMSNYMSRLPSNIQSAHNLNTLMLQANDLGCKELEVVRNFHQLKYLDLSRNPLDYFPPAICQLKKLECLDLSFNYITSLPVELKELTRLKYLLLEENRISEVPSQLFSGLPSLEVLLLSSCEMMSQSLIIENMDCLKGRLKGLSINACSQTDLDKLALLSVPIRTLRRCIAEQEGSTSLQLLPRPNRPNDLTWSELDRLDASGVGNKIEELVIDQRHGSFPDKLDLCSFSNLKEIVWKGIGQNDVIPRLRSFDISNCDNLQHLSWLVNLPLLEMLTVFGCNNLKQVIRKEEETERVGNKPAVVTLYSLRALHLEILPELETICNCTLHLPSLERLGVVDCGRLKKLPFDTPASCSKLKEIEADEEWWDDTLEMDDDMRTHLQYSCSIMLDD